jgi:Zn-dependent protease
LFRIRGIQLSVHITFLFLLGYVAWEGWREFGALGASINLGVVCLFFTCVVLHELGHAFTARAFGVRVPRILLLPIGGMAEFSNLPRRPRAEILIAIAGPAVNALIVAALLLLVPLPSRAQLTAFDLTLWQLLLVMNAMMGAFNLLPAFPMDGGRVLRALLSVRLRYVDATRWAATVGKVLAGVGAAVMAFGFHHLMGTLLFLFIIVVGELEWRAVRRQDAEEERWRAYLERLHSPPPGNATDAKTPPETEPQTAG